MNDWIEVTLKKNFTGKWQAIVLGQIIETGFLEECLPHLVEDYQELINKYNNLVEKCKKGELV